MKEITEKRMLEVVIKLADVIDTICAGMDGQLPQQDSDNLADALNELQEMRDSYRPKVITFWGPNNRSPACYCDTTEEAKELAIKYATQNSGWQQVERVQVWLPGGIEPYYEVKGGWLNDRNSRGD